MNVPYDRETGLKLPPVECRWSNGAVDAQSLASRAVAYAAHLGRLFAHYSDDHEVTLRQYHVML